MGPSSDKLGQRVGIDPKHADVVCRVVDLAEREAIRDFGSPPDVTVRKDVSRVQQIDVPQTAHGALLAVGIEHEVPEALLMETLADHTGGVRLCGLGHAKYAPALAAPRRDTGAGTRAATPGVEHGCPPVPDRSLGSGT